MCSTDFVSVRMVARVKGKDPRINRAAWTKRIQTPSSMPCRHAGSPSGASTWKGDYPPAGGSGDLVQSMRFEEHEGTWVLVVEGRLSGVLAKLAPNNLAEVESEGRTRFHYDASFHRALSGLIDALAMIRWNAPTMRQLALFEVNSDE